MKSILITGATSGFGLATTKLFLEKGWHVYAGVRSFDSDSFKNLAAIKAENLTPIKLDVTNQKDLENLKHQLSQLDVLVNNAGFGVRGPVETLSIDDYQDMFGVNTFGAMMVTKAVLPIMRRSRQGKVINISSINGLVNLPLYGLYSASKHALETLSETMHFELKPFNISVSLIEPGVFITDFSKNTRLAEDLTGSVYEDWAKPFIEELNKKVKKTQRNKLIQGRANPRRIADLIYQITQTDKPKVRYLKGIDARLAYYFRKVLPYPLWSAFLKLLYKW